MASIIIIGKPGTIIPTTVSARKIEDIFKFVYVGNDAELAAVKTKVQNFIANHEGMEGYNILSFTLSP